MGRRNLTAALGVGGLVLAAPGIARAQTREIVIGGAASHKPWFEA
ncbi:MAG: ABC transporter substrate-binding protein, partial [Acetobacteraceae bacterium]|nr:ABC transporter substrate-binding protein [Acetobacteraceae bacterium]